MATKPTVPDRDPTEARMGPVSDEPMTTVMATDTTQAGRDSQGVIIDATRVAKPDTTPTKIKVTTGGSVYVDGFGDHGFEAGQEYMVPAEVLKAINDRGLVKYETVSAAAAKKD